MSQCFFSKYNYKVGCCPLKNFSLKHSRIVAKVNGFFGNVIMTVVDKHTCSSPVVIKLGAFCVEVDGVVERFNFSIVFLYIGYKWSSYCPDPLCSMEWR